MRLSWRTPASDNEQPVDRYRVEWQERERKLEERANDKASGWHHALDTPNTFAIVDNLPSNAAGVRFRVSASRFD